MLRLPEDENPQIIEYVSTNLNALLDWACQHSESMLDYFPAGTGADRAHYETVSLGKLLKHKECFTPELIQEYLMFHVIQRAIDEGYELPPLPSDLTTEVDEDGEPLYGLYADISEWPEVLFWDWDFMMLDEMTAEQLLGNPVSDMMGIGPANGTILELDGKRVMVTVRAWE